MCLLEQVKYTQKDILDRVFKQKRMGVGYDPADVDSFLDDIIKDYGAFSNRIDQLQGEVSKLQSALKQAQDQLTVAKSQATNVTSSQVSAEPSFDAASTQSETVQPVTNLDLIKRVANLERAVFGRDHDTIISDLK